MNDLNPCTQIFVIFWKQQYLKWRASLRRGLYRTPQPVHYRWLPGLSVYWSHQPVGRLLYLLQCVVSFSMCNMTWKWLKSTAYFWILLFHSMSFPYHIDQEKKNQSLAGATVCVELVVPPIYVGFLPHLKDVHMRWIGVPKLPQSECGCE